MENLVQKSHESEKGPIQRAHEEVERGDSDRFSLKLLNISTLSSLAAGAGYLHAGIDVGSEFYQGLGYGILAGTTILNVGVRSARLITGKPAFKYSKKEKD
jgi:hypothetical protein